MKIVTFDAFDTDYFKVYNEGESYRKRIKRRFPFTPKIINVNGPKIRTPVTNYQDSFRQKLQMSDLLHEPQVINKDWRIFDFRERRFRLKPTPTKAFGEELADRFFGIIIVGRWRLFYVPYFAKFRSTGCHFQGCRDDNTPNCGVIYVNNNDSNYKSWTHDWIWVNKPDVYEQRSYIKRKRL